MNLQKNFGAFSEPFSPQVPCHCRHRGQRSDRLAHRLRCTLPGICKERRQGQTRFGPAEHSFRSQHAGGSFSIPSTMPMGSGAPLGALARALLKSAPMAAFTSGRFSTPAPGRRMPALLPLRQHRARSICDLSFMQERPPARRRRSAGSISVPTKAMSIRCPLFRMCSPSTTPHGFQ